MPITNPDALANPRTDNLLSDAPSGDTPFSELFGENGSAALEPTTAAPDATATPVAPTTPAQEFLLKAGSSVYKSVEAAQRGIEEKDNLIKQLRERYIAERGVDPITNQPVRQADAPVNYTRDVQKYVKDLASAVEKNDPNVYAQTQAKFVYDLLEPIAPIIQDFAKTKAQATVEAEYKDFGTFRSSEDFHKVMDSNPVLKNAIDGAERDIRFSSQLPELYKLAYNTYQSSRLPELIKQATASATPAPPTQARPTLTPSTTTPAPTTPAMSREEALRTPEGRQQLIKDLEAKGLGNLTWTGRY